MYLNDTNEFILFWVYRITVLFIVTHCFYQLECLVGSGPVNLQKTVYHYSEIEVVRVYGSPCLGYSLLHTCTLIIYPVLLFKVLQIQLRTKAKFISLFSTNWYYGQN